MTNSQKIRKPLPDAVRVVSLNVHAGDELAEKAMFLLRYHRAARRIIKRNKVAVIHHHAGRPINPLAFDRAFSKYPFILGHMQFNPPHIYNEDTPQLRWGHAWSDYRKPSVAMRMIWHLRNQITGHTNPVLESIIRATLNRADAITVPTNAAKEFFSHYVPKDKISLIPEAVNTNEFAYTVPPNDHTMLAAGGFFQHQGFEYLLHAMVEICGRYPDSRLYLLGAGPRESQLKQLATNLQIDSNVVFHGQVPHYEMPHFFRKARIVCLPSLAKSAGLTQLEAMSCGRPIVATDAIGHVESIENGKTGFIVPKANSMAMAEAALRLFADDELTQKMGAYGRMVVEERHSVTRVAKRYYDLYERISN